MEAIKSPKSTNHEAQCFHPSAVSYTVTHWHCSSAARKGFLRTRYIRLAVPCHSFLASVGISQDEVRAPLKPLSVLDSGTPRLHINESLLQNKHGTIVHLKQHTANTTNPKKQIQIFFFQWPICKTFAQINSASSKWTRDCKGDGRLLQWNCFCCCHYQDLIVPGGSEAVIRRLLLLRPDNIIPLLPHTNF